MWNEIQLFLDKLPPFAWNLLLAAAAVVSGLLLWWILSFVLAYFSRHTSGFSLFRSFIIRLAKPLSLFLPLCILDLALSSMKLSRVYFTTLDKITVILLIISFAWVLVGFLKVAEDFVIHAYDLNKVNNLKERKIRTQLQFVRKLIIGLIVTLTICSILLTFDKLRQLGTGLLTGVGVGGIIVGFAAQRSLGNFLAGLQIAFTQPIRIDDVLVVEGEYGRVEEITFTYVVLSIWDERRLILPINYFIEKPFQNWTRNSSEILGTVFLYLDYTAPVSAIREEFTRLMATTELWDKRVQVLQVTNASEGTMEIRLLMSASNSGRAFDLRCYIREQLIAYIQKNHPDCLPRTRAVVDNLAI